MICLCRPVREILLFMIYVLVNRTCAGEAWAWSRGNCEPHITGLGTSNREEAPLIHLC